MNCPNCRRFLFKWRMQARRRTKLDKESRVWGRLSIAVFLAAALLTILGSAYESFVLLLLSAPLVLAGFLMMLPMSGGPLEEVQCASCHRWLHPPAKSFIWARRSLVALAAAISLTFVAIAFESLVLGVVCAALGLAGFVMAILSGAGPMVEAQEQSEAQPGS